MKEVALEFLKKLGDDQFQVAAKLEELGIRGLKGNCTGCPIARYLMLSLGYKRVVDPPISVAPTFIVANDGKGWTRWAVPRHEIPKAVVDFMVAFDRGGFPRLLAGEFGL